MILLQECIKLQPDFTEAWVVRGNVLHSMERQFDALLHYDRALNFNDKLQDAWNNRGLAAADIGMFSMAEDCFYKSLECMPALEPYMGLANLHCTLMRLPEAAESYRKAILCGAGSDAHFNLGVTLLGMGQWEEGFKEYEHRWLNTPYPPRPYRQYPKWRGEDLSNKRIILYGEQGYGDEIMAVRFAKIIEEHYFNTYVVVMARGPVLELFKREYRAVPMNDGKHYPADYSCPLLDVPMVLGLGPDQVGVLPVNYIGPLDDYDGHYSYDWANRIKMLPKGLNVGLCWSSGGHLNTAKAAQQAKSIPLIWLKPLAMPGVNLISLQKDNRDPIPPEMQLVDWTSDLHDFADTAALIEELDLVISVDTAVAHLAGALGKPVWNFVRYSGYWPWLTAEAVGDPRKSIWYPSMTLLRQPSLANWDEPIKTAVTMLKNFAGTNENRTLQAVGATAAE